MMSPVGTLPTCRDVPPESVVRGKATSIKRAAAPCSRAAAVAFTSTIAKQNLEMPRKGTREKGDPLVTRVIHKPLVSHVTRDTVRLLLPSPGTQARPLGTQASDNDQSSVAVRMSWSTAS